MSQIASAQTVRIALVGNPNTGKTSLFNVLCGTRQKTGNYPGVTVEKKIGLVPSSQYNQHSFSVIDLPGLYSLRPASPDERVSAKVLLDRMEGVERPGHVVFVADATNLQRNLYLFSQIRELDVPVLVALTMTDLLEKSGQNLDVEELQKELGVPVVPVVAGDATSVQSFRRKLDQFVDQSPLPEQHLAYEAKLESVLDEFLRQARGHHQISRQEALQLLIFPGDERQWEPNEAVLELAEDAIEKLKAAGLQSPGVLTRNRYSWSRGVTEKVIQRIGKAPTTFRDRMDRFLTGKVTGFASFLVIMAVVFQSIYAWAGPLMDGIEWIFSALGELAGSGLSESPVLQSLLVDGILAGVGSVLVFLPQIMILFAFIAILEDSGYLARTAFMMDRLLGWTGLNGRSFIPLLSSFACAIPGVMSARVIGDERARKATILVAPLMSCSARLPVYVLFIGAFIEPSYGPLWAGAMLFFMHFLGLFVALPVSFILNRGFLKTPPSPFVLEMPPYRMPMVKNVAIRVYESAKKFVVRAGTVIFALSIIIWALSYFPSHNQEMGAIEARYSSLIEQAQTADARESEQSPEAADNEELANVETLKEPGDSAILEPEEQPTKIEQLQAEKERALAGARLEGSYLGMAGKWVQPAFAPLGFDWKLTVGILSAFPAREVIVSTLGIIYNAQDEEEGLKLSLSSAKDEEGNSLYGPLHAITMMVFFALCAQCMSTLVVVQKELGSWKYALYTFVYMTGLAYLAGLLVYQIGSLL
ncbi:MAG: ferrous iron transport protein B [Spirochaetaceae bacterium]|nr:ferrous iron transport protein B [Spirochaetaceae bacterium]|tara:strand:- start:76532 stop:78808 length:2277 start_codon:yes stop_codon:yes gene_type:complete